MFGYMDAARRGTRLANLLWLLALSTWAQEASWERLGLSGHAFWVDSNHTTGFKRVASPDTRLAADASGRLYLCNGSSLLIGSEGGTCWKRFSPPPSSNLKERQPLAAGGDGTVFWGNWLSRDGGATWDSKGMDVATAYGVLPDGASLAGSSYDALARAPASSLAWSRVHMGQTYGFIRKIEIGKGWPLFALPSYDSLLHSMDTGKTWRAWTAHGQGSWMGRDIRLMAGERLSGSINPLWLVLQSRNTYGKSSGNALVRMYTVYTSIDTIRTGLPDSMITALRITSDRAVWLGTRGQGVWVRRDYRGSFAPVNEGLTGAGLDIVAMEPTSDGRLFVLTRDGLYRLRMELSTLTLPRRRSAFQPPKASLHIPGLPGEVRASGTSGAGYQVLPDGRVVIPPYSRRPVMETAW